MCLGVCWVGLLSGSGLAPPPAMLVRVFDRVKVLNIGDLPIEVRGWSQDVREVAFEYLPTVSEVFTPCLTHRDVYIRRVLNIQPRVNDALAIGRLLHEAYLAPFRLLNRASRGSVIDELAELKAKILNDLPGEVAEFGKVVFEEASRVVMDVIYDGYPLPISVEPQLEGSIIGFSDGIKPDLLVGLIPVEVAVTDNQDYIARKELALTAYALAIEAYLGNPVNYGILIVLNPTLRSIQYRQVILSDPLRRSVLRERDEVARIVARKDGPGPLTIWGNFNEPSSAKNIRQVRHKSSNFYLEVG